MMLNVVIAGCSGRMGHALLQGVMDDPELKLHAALDRSGSPAVGRDAGELFGAPCGVQVTDNLDAALQGADVLVDFTRPEATMEYLAACCKAGVALVIGTTGFSVEQNRRLLRQPRTSELCLPPT